MKGRALLLSLANLIIPEVRDSIQMMVREVFAGIGT
jgi:hypothetical protein